MSTLQQSSNPAGKSREVRLGIVMYGGVSLAIYINGVAREFFDAVRGRGVYRLIKALTDSDIVVDVISGTSAGGINGIMLSYALCNGCEFSKAADLWRMHGDLGKLLRAPDDQANAISLLNSEGYYQPKIEEVFRKMTPCDGKIGEDPSAITELDLYVTSTNVNGRIYTQFDDKGHPIDVKDHRAVFHLSHRSGRDDWWKQPFSTIVQTGYPKPDVTFKALGTLSRATSCFPAAFAPVEVKVVPPEKLQRDGDKQTADSLLQRWGKLDADSPDTDPESPKAQSVWFLDGGVLDNKPFTYTIQAISSRNSDRAVSRTLFYVEPDPECLKAVAQPKGPNILQSVLAALIGIPGYESISEDLKLIATRNSKIVRYNRLLKQLLDDLRRKKNPDPSKPAILSTPTPEAWTLYVKCRLVALSERVLLGIFREQGQDSLIRKEGDREHAAKLIESFDKKVIPEDLLNSLDSFYYHRRTLRLIYHIHGLADNTAYLPLLRALNCFADAYDIISAAMAHLVDKAKFNWQAMPPDQVWDTVTSAILGLLDSGLCKTMRWPSPDEYSQALAKGDFLLTPDFLADLSTRLRTLGKEIADKIENGKLEAPAPGTVTFLITLDDYERRTIEHFTKAGDSVRLAEANFPCTDAMLFPLEMVGDLQEKDVIKTVRISPLDAQRGFSENKATNKVAGDAMHHFGGFFKRSWRSNDILWGRLDGTCQLIETLLDRDRLTYLTAEPARRKAIADIFFSHPTTQPPGFFAELDPARLFPNAGAGTHLELSNWLADLLTGDETALKSALEKSRFDQITTTLVQAAQFGVLEQDFPTVVLDSISEQADWNRFKTTPPPPVEEPGCGCDGATPSAFTFQAPNGTLDPFFASVAAEERTRQIMRQFEDGKDFATNPANKPADTRLGDYFMKKYGVGAEELTRDIPTPVLFELLAHTLLVTRNCVLNLFGKSLRNRVTSNLIYRFAFDFPLRVVHAAAIISRRSPARARSIYCIVCGASVSALVIGITLLVTQGGMSFAPFMLLIVLPAFLLIAGGILLVRTSRRI